LKEFGKKFYEIGRKNMIRLKDIRKSAIRYSSTSINSLHSKFLELFRYVNEKFRDHPQVRKDLQTFIYMVYPKIGKILKEG